MHEDEKRQEEPDDMDRFLTSHIARLTAFKAEERDEMKREILQARIDNLRRAQQLWAAEKAEPGHA